MSAYGGRQVAASAPSVFAPVVAQTKYINKPKKGLPTMSDRLDRIVVDVAQNLRRNNAARL